MMKLIRMIQQQKEALEKQEKRIAELRMERGEERVHSEHTNKREITWNRTAKIQIIYAQMLEEKIFS